MKEIKPIKYEYYRSVTVFTDDSGDEVFAGTVSLTRYDLISTEPYVQYSRSNNFICSLKFSTTHIHPKFLKLPIGDSAILVEEYIYNKLLQAAMTNEFEIWNYFA